MSFLIQTRPRKSDTLFNAGLEGLPIRRAGPQGFAAGAQVEQTDQDIEHIARAFFVAWHQDASWETASRILKHEFRLYARQAIGMLEKNQERTWTAPRETPRFDAFEAA